MPELLPFALTALLVELTPGPNMAFLATLALDRGRRAALMCVAGIATGLLLMGIAAAFGLAGLLQTFPPLSQFLGVGGVLYLLWLAWEGWRDADEARPAQPDTDDLWQQFRHGLITNLLNPKAALFYAATLPRFIRHEGELPTERMFAVEATQGLILIAVYVAIASAVHLAIATLAVRARAEFDRGGRIIMIRKALALSLAGVAIWLALSLRIG